MPVARALGAVSVSDSRPECVNDDAAAGAAAAAGACGAVRPWDPRDWQAVRTAALVGAAADVGLGSGGITR